MTEYDLTALYQRTNEACESAFNLRKQIGGAVNWADLGCVSAEKWVNHLGETGYRVIIEEVSPGADDFRKYIWECLTDSGFTNVEISTEW